MEREHGWVGGMRGSLAETKLNDSRSLFDGWLQQSQSWREAGCGEAGCHGGSPAMLELDTLYPEA
ncbi:hypothetical protein F5887DRAFT_1085553 [Amanita rubescens]|nr:hypothetical protein F5887DRAFT_1085553 [Amanita rubescens]